VQNQAQKAWPSQPIRLGGDSQTKKAETVVSAWLLCWVSERHVNCQSSEAEQFSLRKCEPQARRDSLRSTEQTPKE